MQKYLHMLMMSCLLIVGTAAGTASLQKTITTYSKESLARLTTFLEKYGAEIHFGAMYIGTLCGNETLVGEKLHFLAKSAAASTIGLKTMPQAWQLGCGNGGTSLLLYDLIGFLVRGAGAEIAALITRAFLGMQAGRIVVDFK